MGDPLPVGAGEESGADAQAPFGSDTELVLHHISNGMAEWYNSRIQSIKTVARGFRNFANYRTRTLFFCGNLNLLPNSTHKNVR